MLTLWTTAPTFAWQVGLAAQRSKRRRVFCRLTRLPMVFGYSSSLLGLDRARLGPPFVTATGGVPPRRSPWVNEATSASDPQVGAVVAVVLPEMHHPPPETSERGVLPAVAPLIGGDLVRPPRAVAPRAVEATRAAMPEAPVDEYRDE
jgi:hypothetical protein